MDEQLKKDLEGLLVESADVEVNDGDFTATPDGIYDGVVSSCEWGETKEKHTPKFTIETIITGPVYANKHEWKTYVFNGPKNFKRFTTDLSKFGVDVSSMDKIENTLERVLDVPITLTIKTSKPSDNFPEGFRNVSIEPAE